MRLATRKSEIERLQGQEQCHYVTAEALGRMEKELERLTKHDRQMLAEEVARTAAMGDLSENAAYQIAKTNLRRVNARILSLTDRLAMAVVIPAGATSDGVVRIGSTVTVERADEVDLRKYRIVGSAETDPARGRISSSSGLGMALIGRQVGERVGVNGIDFLIRMVE